MAEFVTVHEVATRICALVGAPSEMADDVRGYLLDNASTVIKALAEAIGQKDGAAGDIKPGVALDSMNDGAA